MKGSDIQLRIFFLFLVVVNPAHSSVLGRLCVLPTTKEPLIGERGAFQSGPGGTSEFVQVQINKGKKQEVSPEKSANFINLDIGMTHTVSVFSFDGKSRLLSFKIKFEDPIFSFCMKRKKTYGTWDIEPSNTGCKCP